MSQELQQLREENKQIKDLLVNEVAARQQMGGRLEGVTKSAQSQQIQFSAALCEIRKMAEAGETAPIIEKVNSLIGAEPKNEVAAP